MISCGCASNRNTLCNDSANLPCSDPRNPTTRSFWTAPRCWAFLICSTAIDLQVSSARQATAMRSLVVPSTAPSVRPLSARPHTAPAVSQRGSRQVARANPLENVINSLTVALKNSPLNEGKKALAKAQAGQYDEAAVRSKINGLIADNAVGMLVQLNLMQNAAACHLQPGDMRCSWTTRQQHPTQSAISYSVLTGCTGHGMPCCIVHAQPAGPRWQHCYFPSHAVGRGHGQLRTPLCHHTTPDA